MISENREPWLDRANQHLDNLLVKENKDNDLLRSFLLCLAHECTKSHLLKTGGFSLLSYWSQEENRWSQAS